MLGGLPVPMAAVAYRGTLPSLNYISLSHLILTAILQLVSPVDRHTKKWSLAKWNDLLTSLGYPGDIAGKSPRLWTLSPKSLSIKKRYLYLCCGKFPYFSSNYDEPREALIPSSNPSILSRAQCRENLCLYKFSGASLTLYIWIWETYFPLAHWCSTFL